MPRPSNREHLLDYAEELYARHGVGGVSLRTIQAAAGLSVGSLRYHFKTEAGLVAAVMERRIEPLMARHEMLLDALASNPNPSVDEVLGALIRPLVELLHAEPEQGRRYLTLMHRLQVEHHTAPILVARWPDFAERTEGLLKKSLSHLPRGVIEFRFGLAWETILGSLARVADLSTPDLEEYVAALIGYLSGALEAPQLGRRSARPKTR
ncbi:MAG: TetR/AcrR family transcriptional regulator [Myxococcales bacterium]|nr:TetR/AcrR family transcriptional regulator [Myxococcales bacterium]